MRQIDVDYDGDLSRNYDRGRELNTEAIETWRSAIHEHIPRAGAIVDVGAGTGRFARQFNALAPGRVLAVEPSAGMRAAAPRSVGSGTKQRVNWIGGSAEDLPLAPESAAVIWSAFTTHYLDLRLAAAEFYRVMVPGGRVLIWHAFPDVFDRLEWFRWFRTARALDEKRMPTAPAVQAAFEAAGFECLGRTEHRMRIADDLGALADRLANRSISTMTLIPDDEFASGLASLRAEASRSDESQPVYAPNVMLAFSRPKA